MATCYERPGPPPERSCLAPGCGGPSAVRRRPVAGWSCAGRGRTARLPRRSQPPPHLLTTLPRTGWGGRCGRRRGTGAARGRAGERPVAPKVGAPDQRFAADGPWAGRCGEAHGRKVGRAAASARRLPPSWRGGRLGPGDPRCGRAPSPHPGEASLRRRGVARACVSIGSRRRACRRSRFPTTGAVRESTTRVAFGSRLFVNGRSWPLAYCRRQDLLSATLRRGGTLRTVPALSLISGHPSTEHRSPVIVSPASARCKSLRRHGSDRGEGGGNREPQHSGIPRRFCSTFSFASLAVFIYTPDWLSVLSTISVQKLKHHDPAGISLKQRHCTVSVIT